MYVNMSNHGLNTPPRLDLQRFDLAALPLKPRLEILKLKENQDAIKNP
jgi:hypothetical protein